MKVLIACECSGVVRRAFRERGHDAYSVDIKPAEDGSPYHIQDSIFHVLAYAPWSWDLMIAHPECRRLCNSGVRWLVGDPPTGKTNEQMWDEFEQAVEFYIALRAVPIERKAIENSVFHRYARERIAPELKQVVQPWWFGEKLFKATQLELINLPPLVPTNKLLPPKSGTEDHKKWSAVHRASPGPDRSANRARFTQGLAEAMAMQWG
jgi:hypothetical protein